MEDKKIEKEEAKKGEVEGHDKKIHFEIQIDRKIYRVEVNQMTGLELRGLPRPPIGPDRDLFEIVPGGTDKKIGDADVVEMRHGLRFFSAPAQINPGAER